MTTTGPVAAAIARMSADDAKAYILAAFGALPLPEPFSFAGLDIALSSVFVVGPKLVVYASVSRDGAAIELADHIMPLEFVNPPIFVPDGTTTPVTVTDPKGGQTVIDEPNLIEDLPAALRWMVGDTFYTLQQRGNV